MKAIDIRRSFIAALAVLVIPGCAFNPIVRREPVPLETAVGTNQRPLQSGLALAAERRNAYEDKVREFVSTQVVLTNSLVGLGAVGMGLLASRGVHRDAVLGTALAGGTGYVVGRFNLDERRLPIYEKAIASYLCLERAAVPLNLSASDYAALKSEDNPSFASLIADAVQATTNAEIQLAGWAGTTTEKASYQGQIAAAKQQIDQAQKVAVSAFQIASRIDEASGVLVVTARKIDARARKELESTVGSLDSVKAVIASIPGAAADIVPGFKFAQASVDAPKVKTEGGQGAPFDLVNQAPSVPDAVKGAMIAMQEALRKMTARELVVRARLKAVPTVRLESLENCAAGDEGSGGMTVAPGTVAILPGKEAVYPLTIQGGKPPFGVKPFGPELSGLTLVPPIKLESEFSLKASSTLTQGSKAAFVVTDSSTPNQRFDLLVNVGEPPVPKTDVNAASQVPENGGSADIVRSFMFDDTIKLTATQKLSQGAKTMRLSCEPKPAQCLNQAAVRKAYLVANPIDKDVPDNQLKFANGAGPGCICKD